ncbi:hypothetical protein BDV3_003179 [Batrachochytrium dendrobatidis]
MLRAILYGARDCPAYQHHSKPTSSLYFSTWWVVGLAVGGVLMLATTILSLHLTIMHFRYYTKPQFQRPITRILLMVPLYSICSLLSFWSVKWAVYINVVRDCYEGFVVYNFFTLCLEYLGPTEHVRLQVLATKQSRRFPPPACCLTHSPSHFYFLGFCKLGILQYVYIRIITTLASLAMEIGKVYCSESMSPYFGHMYTTVFNSISVGLAMFTLISFYLPIRHDISHYNLVGQFLSIKFVIFFQFWLGITIKLLANSGTIHATDDWTVGELSTLIQSFVVIVEMMIASILHLWAFNYKIFVPEDKSVTPIAKGAWDSFYWLDLWHDTIRIYGFLYYTVFLSGSPNGENDSHTSSATPLYERLSIESEADSIDSLNAERAFLIRD